MYEHETFPHAPITEAVADFSVVFDKPLTFDDLADFSKIAAQRFPGRRERRTYSTAISFKEEGPVFQDTENKFLAYTSKDGREVAQVRTDGFSFSRLKPYTNWEDFSAKAQAALKMYADLFAPVAISKLTLEYINRIQIPGNTIDFDEYFKTGIKIAPGLPRAITDAFYRFTLKINDHSVIVMFASDFNARTDTAVSVVFDIEAINTNGVPVDFNDINSALNELRKIKNDVFFNSITGKIRELFR